MTPKRKLRHTTQAIFVFCEGETEQRYIDLLRMHFRVPIQVVTKVLYTKISQRLIDMHIKNCGYSEIDKVFLFYDGDRQDIVDKIYGISNAQVMLSCPCVELWFLLHFTEHTAAATSDKILQTLLKHSPTYKKGLFQDRFKDSLLSNWKTASLRAKRLTPKTNPSTSAYILPEYLESIRKT